MSILFDYSFVTVAIGACLLAFCGALVGSLSVLSNQSLIGDTLAHASYPGVIFAYMLTQDRAPIILMCGAIFSGYVSYYLVHYLTDKLNHSYTNALTIISSSFFGLGMVLNQFLQGNAHFSKAAQAGLKNYLFGQAAFIQEDDIWLIVIVSFITIAIFIRYYESFCLYLSDKTFAKLQGVNVSLMKHLSTFMVVLLISVGLKVVGAILMSSFLVAPAVTGMLPSKHFKQSLVIASITAVVSAFIGTYASSTVKGLSTGPAIIIVMSFIALVTFVCHTHREKGGGTWKSQ
ncbi:metal ABC transporter permease [Carnobacteriaceae bacterium zg-ZUI252]|nr:metal ABC transporter permease [Carnobacteriaceae bacterium zg-ZUI252]